MTPNPSARQWRLAGHRPDGQAIEQTLVLFAHGTRVVQASALGERIDPAALGTFVESLHVAR